MKKKESRSRNTRFDYCICDTVNRPHTLHYSK